MPYTREHQPDTEFEEEDEPIVVPENASAEEVTFAKRYGDLRRYSQEKEAQNRARIQALEARIEELSKRQLELPDANDEAAIEEWVSRFPDIAKVVTGIARNQAKTATQTLEQRMKELDERENKFKKEQAEKKLIEAHPDFFELRDNPAFHEWLGEQSHTMQDALYNNEFDWKTAAAVITQYKVENGLTDQNKRKSPANTRDAARDIRTPSNTHAPRGSAEYTFTESQIASMSIHEYERNEEAIDKARAEGKILMDISAGAR